MMTKNQLKPAHRITYSPAWALSILKVQQLISYSRLGSTTAKRRLGLTNKEREALIVSVPSSAGVDRKVLAIDTLAAVDCRHAGVIRALVAAVEGTLEGNGAHGQILLNDLAAANRLTVLALGRVLHLLRAVIAIVDPPAARLPPVFNFADLTARNRRHVRSLTGTYC